jgi:hypothetical protein
MDNSKVVELLDFNTGIPLRPPVASIAVAAGLLKISRNMLDRYMNSQAGFYSKVFGKQITANILGFPLTNKTITHRKDSNYPPLVLPGGLLSALPHFVV